MKKVTAALLHRMPLVRPSGDDNKDDRGTVLVVGGSSQLPGPVLLAGIAALRAGAGKLQLAVPREIGVPLGLAVPEAMVASDRAIAALARTADAILIGPGMPLRKASVTAARNIATIAKPEAVIVLDAAALPAAGIRAPSIITPHVGEIARLLNLDEAEVEANAPDVALEAALRFGCVVALKSNTTVIAFDGDTYLYDGGSVGLATSGSGDTLAGIIGGLAARGADPLTATLWAVWAHGSAGRLLARRVAPTGFLARELLAELPRLLNG
jgi:hydroxyethylthiazole kinase-like uncharacterized protein yjeF